MKEIRKGVIRANLKGIGLGDAYISPINYIKKYGSYARMLVSIVTFSTFCFELLKIRTRGSYTWVLRTVVFFWLANPAKDYAALWRNVREIKRFIKRDNMVVSCLGLPGGHGWPTCSFLWGPHGSVYNCYVKVSL